MRLAISNIAWDVAEDQAVAELLQRYGVDAIDIAPGKYFPVPADASAQDIARVKSWWAERGIEITGMQSLLFGTTGLNVFGSDESQTALLRHLSAICRIAGELGATRLVFGSPKNRDRTGLNDQQALDAAVRFFRKLGDVAQDNGVFICLEPNPVCYGANFMTTSPETAHVVRQVAHPAIRMQFDTGALAINDENPLTLLEDSAELIGHVHASEPNLVPLGDGGTEHGSMSAAVQRYLPEHVVSIEMVATANEPHIVSIERALAKAIQFYGVQDEGIVQ
ncbi:sugar phosphate isomerase/epimerase family protein [Pseudomonas lini]|uniref:sugar phosphate isomerase/epimerase family protein n=1 Tax=Pseudomonas lini TaxID=163011 RepID=UPI00345ED19A